MATLKAVIVPAKALSNGKHKIRIAVSHKQDTRYIVTRYEVDDVNQFKDGRVVGREDSSLINRRLNSLINDYYNALDSIDPEPYTCSQLRDFIEKSKKIKGVLISKAADDHINKQAKKNTIDSYKRTLKYFINFAGDVPVEMINPDMIADFDKFLTSEMGMSSTSRAIHLRQLKAFINPQINKGNVTFKIKPFSGFLMPESLERELDITVDEFRLIRDADVKEKPLRVARDLFCLSYYLGGINLVDLLGIDFNNITVVEYIREKSRLTKRGEKRVSLTIQPEAMEIIKRWRGRNGKLDFGYNYTYDNLRKYVNSQIKRLAKRLNINKRVVYYSARKSLVQHGFELGFSLDILEYSIGHSVKKNRPIFNYVRMMREHADKVMRAILDNLK